MSVEDVYSWDKPSCPAFVSDLGLIQALDLLLKDCENITRGIARLELVGEGNFVGATQSIFPGSRDHV
jgi:hypothetical protein